MANTNGFHGVNAKPGRKKKRPLTKKQKTYVDTYVKTGSHRKAIEEAGYASNMKPMNSRAVQKAVQSKQAIMREKFIADAEVMYNNMKELALTGESEMVRFKATSDILDRAGLAPVAKQEIETTKTISLDSRISQDLISRYMKQRNMKTVDNETGEVVEEVVPEQQEGE